MLRPTAAPPIWLGPATWYNNMPFPLGMAAVPDLFVPIRFSTMRLFFAGAAPFEI
jgi:hypothetical protein